MTHLELTTVVTSIVMTPFVAVGIWAWRDDVRERRYERRFERPMHRARKQVEIGILRHEVSRDAKRVRREIDREFE